MRFGVFYELQLPRPWDEGDERRIVAETLEQIELADRLGFDNVWMVEHHFLEEYSHCAAPEVILAAAAQRTTRIRLGHGIVLLPPAFNPPARVAERISTLDLVSNGRVEFGTGESSSSMELDGFGVPRDEKRDQWAEALDAITRMFVEEPFAGYEGRWVRMPPRNVVPKPLQRPHPPLWVACSRRETIHLAAQKGIGALSFAFIDPAEARFWVDDYYSTLVSEECVPAGFAVNANVAAVTAMMCHPDEETALSRGIDGARFFAYALAHYYAFGAHAPGRTDIWEGYLRDGAQMQWLDAVRGAVGTPDQVRELLRGYEEGGVDQIVFVSQAGRNRHEHICEAMELVAHDILPEFRERDATVRARRMEVVGPAIERALARRTPPRPAPEDHVVRPGALPY
jgi:alkanesulfonate monooxygenase SsuD/methylene tetrahydromethanopterin reductase-like flavin-dependent oxidoreductase (luciferase family)